MRYDEPMTDRLRAVAEEAVHSLLGDGESGQERKLLLVARGDGRSADLEFIAAGADENLEEQLAVLSEGVTGWPNEAEIPLRLLRHYATSRAPPAIPRHRHRDVPRGPAGGPARGPGDPQTTRKQRPARCPEMLSR